MGWRRFGSAGPAAGWRVFLGWCGPLRVDAVSGEGALGCGRQEENGRGAMKAGWAQGSRVNSARQFQMLRWVATGSGGFD